MLTGAFRERERALEEFFYRLNKRLLEQLRQSIDEKNSLQALAETSGLHDEDLLRKLLALGISAESLVAMRLVRAPWKRHIQIFSGTESMVWSHCSPAWGLGAKS